LRAAHLVVIKKLVRVQVKKKLSCKDIEIDAEEMCVKLSASFLHNKAHLKTPEKFNY